MGSPASNPSGQLSSLRTSQLSNFSFSLPNNFRVRELSFLSGESGNLIMEDVARFIELRKRIRFGMMQHKEMNSEMDVQTSDSFPGLQLC